MDPPRVAATHLPRASASHRLRLQTHLGPPSLSTLDKSRYRVRSPRSISASIAIMSTTILSHNAARLPIASTLVMIYGSYQVHQIYTGKHPQWSPRLEAAGITGFTNGDSESAEPGSSSRVATTGDATGVSDTPIRWTTVNGIPIPTLAAFMGTSREE